MGKAPTEYDWLFPKSVCVMSIVALGMKTTAKKCGTCMDKDKCVLYVWGRAGYV